MTTHLRHRRTWAALAGLALHWRGVRTRWLATQVRYPLDGVSHYRMFLDNVRMTSLHVRLVLGMLMRMPLLLWRKANA